MPASLPACAQSVACAAAVSLCQRSARPRRWCVRGVGRPRVVIHGNLDALAWVILRVPLLLCGWSLQAASPMKIPTRDAQAWPHWRAPPTPKETRHAQGRGGPTPSQRAAAAATPYTRRCHGRRRTCRPAAAAAGAPAAPGGASAPSATVADVSALRRVKPMMGDRSRPKTGGMTPADGEGKEAARRGSGSGQPRTGGWGHTPTDHARQQRHTRQHRAHGARAETGGGSGQWLARGRQATTNARATPSLSAYTPHPPTRRCRHPDSPASRPVHRPPARVVATVAAASQRTAEEVEEGVTHGVEG